MSVTISVGGSVADRIGSKSITLNVSSVTELKQELKAKYPEIGKFTFRFFINNKLSEGGNFSETDKVLVLSAYMGG
jgi:hypothetical protein